jgi:hypothetical protein
VEYPSQEGCMVTWTKMSILFICGLKIIEGEKYKGYYGTICMSHISKLVDNKQQVIKGNGALEERIVHVPKGLINGFMYT